MADSAEVNRHLNHLFRREAGRMVAVLTKIFGPGNIDLAESVVQDALTRAAQTWPLRGIPDNPSGWIMLVAKNRALDLIKSRRELALSPESLDMFPSEDGGDALDVGFEAEIHDDQLRLMFLCCHPVVPLDGRVALTLKTICGFGVSEIGRAFLAKDEAIAQRLVRAKQRIKDAGLTFEMPEGQDLADRLDSVVETVYLLFNEGYAASHGDQLTKGDMCLEACRLSKLLANHKHLGLPRVKALAALLLLQASRLEARVDAQGDVLLLDEQDRSRWHQELVSEGLYFLALAASGDELSDYHLMAGIAACHATAASFVETDWALILRYYDDLMASNGSPVIALNRAVAAAFVHGPAAALKDLRRIRDAPQLQGYYLYPATVADLYRQLGDRAKALKYYGEALKLVRTEPERRFLAKRAEACRAKAES